MKRTKIVCTIGPASQSPSTLTALVKAGMNVARLNFSHGSYENHALLIKNIRAVSAKLKIPIAIVQDLQGPKIRVSKLAEPIKLKKGMQLTIGKDFAMDFDVSKYVKAGHRILIEDGLVELLVLRVSGKLIACTVVAHGVESIQSHKGMNLPDTRIAARVLTGKDIKDLKFGLAQDVDYVALSFVRHAKDITDIKSLIRQHTPNGLVEPKVIAKIELAEAVEKFDEILEATDGIMVARGDLGVEVPASQVPVIQKNIVQKCTQAAKPVIVATQMLDSMIRNPRPTRAEVTDVATAVVDRTDAVMLSGETATGEYPVEAVTIMAQIIREVEKSPYALETDELRRRGSIKDMHKSIAEFANRLAESAHAVAIVGATQHGFSARFIAHEHPSVPIIMFSSVPKVHRQMALFWGVESYMQPYFKHFGDLMDNLQAEVKKAKIAKSGDTIIITVGEPLGEKLNLVQVKRIS